MTTMDALLAMPETERLARVLDLLQHVAQDAEKVAREVAAMRAPSPADVAARWEPVIREGVEELARTQVLLRRAREAVRTGNLEWVRTSPETGLLPALLNVSQALSDFLTRVTAMQVEVRSLEMLGTVRSSLLNDLPSPVRQSILRDAAQQRLEDSDGV